MDDTQMLETADALKALRDEKNKMQEQMKALQERIDETEAKLIDMMVNEECTGFDRNGTRFSLVLRAYPGAVPEEKETLYARMKQHGFEHLFTINAMTLQGTLRELKENNDDVLPDWLEGLVRVYEQPSIRVTKSR